nr:MAG TPA: hypothetical protein [Caudoviricetes sp.]
MVGYRYRIYYRSKRKISSITFKGKNRNRRKRN